MKRILSSLALFLCLASTIAIGEFSANAAEKSPEKKAEKSEKAARGRPVMGKVDAVDKTMKTLTLSGEKKQVLQVTSETRIMKAGKPATFDDATVGEAIAGSAVEENGKLVLRSLRIGAKPEEGEKEPKGPAKAKKKAKESAEKASGASGQ
jgi:Cu/Ag efflux protein CusF